VFLAAPICDDANVSPTCELSLKILSDIYHVVYHDFNLDLMLKITIFDNEIA
jgi:hypothetical protein